MGYKKCANFTYQWEQSQQVYQVVSNHFLLDIVGEASKTMLDSQHEGPKDLCAELN